MVTVPLVIEVSNNAFMIYRGGLQYSLAILIRKRDGTIKITLKNYYIGKPQ